VSDLYRRWRVTVFLVTLAAAVLFCIALTAAVLRVLWSAVVSSLSLLGA
jgi:hypothetical protein